MLFFFVCFFISLLIFFIVAQSSPTSIQKIEKIYKDVDTTIYEFDGRADPDNLRKLSQKFLSEKQGPECKLFVLVQENHVCKEVIFEIIIFIISIIFFLNH